MPASFDDLPIGCSWREFQFQYADRPLTERFRAALLRWSLILIGSSLEN
jgi:hypothetical protein